MAVLVGMSVAGPGMTVWSGVGMGVDRAVTVTVELAAKLPVGQYLSLGHRLKLSVARNGDLVCIRWSRPPLSYGPWRRQSIPVGCDWSVERASSPGLAWAGTSSRR